MKDMEKHWESILDASGGYFRILSQAIEKAMSLALSPAMQHTYRKMTYHALLSNKGFIVMRPFIYLEFVRLVLTTPGAEQTPAGFASQMSEAFQPRSYDPFKQRRISDFAWAPPMALALDMTEYLMQHVRHEADLEGFSEAQMIEQLAAQFLTNWMGGVVMTKAGGVLCKAEGRTAVKALQARYNRLVDQLCVPASGGYNLALQLPDFEAGLAGQAFEEEHDD
ncbi:hypothetical protein DFQ26_000702 [Actinomortierella ambigua]|nr:hypothetical protein DFQ26_000702 [Actinomortierella ambigua]